MNKRHYEHTLPNIRGSLSNTYSDTGLKKTDGYAVCISVLIVFQSSGSVPVLTFFPSQ